MPSSRPSPAARDWSGDERGCGRRSRRRLDADEGRCHELGAADLGEGADRDGRAPHARRAVFLLPNTLSVLDVGGQDTKAIRVGDHGQVLDFSMNDKCSARTGRFLGAASQALEIPLGELGPLALTAKNPVRMTTTCTVFAES